MDLTILIPVKNEEDNISNIIDNIEKKLFNLNYEVLFVNDFSTDNTVEIINNYKNLKKNIDIIHNKKIGLGETIKNGIKFSKGKYISIIMCDGSDDIDDLKNYIEIIKKEDLDAVFGSGIAKVPDTAPFASVVKLPPNAPPDGVTYAVILCSSKKGKTLVLGLKP